MENEITQRYGSIAGSIFDEGGSKAPIQGGLVGAWPVDHRKPGEKADARKSYGNKPPRTPTCLYAWSGRTGAYSIPNVSPGKYQVWCESFGQFSVEEVEVLPSCTAVADFHFPIDLTLTMKAYSKGDCRTLEPTDCIFVDQPAMLSVDFNQQIAKYLKTVRFSSPDLRTSVTMLDLRNAQYVKGTAGGGTAVVTIVGLPPTGAIALDPLAPLGGPAGPLPPVTGSAPAGQPPLGGGAELAGSTTFTATPAIAQPIAGRVGVTLSRTASLPTRDQALWVAIRNRTKAVSFSGGGYKEFIDRVLCVRDPLVPANPQLTRQLDELGSQVYGVGAYQLLKTATEAFLLLECGVAIEQTGRFDDIELFKQEEEAARLGENLSLGQLQDRLVQYLGPGQLPYITRVVNAAFPNLPIGGNLHCDNVLTAKVNAPCLIELIWSYWHEEGMLAQTVAAVSRRFQNLRGPGDRDPLAHLEIDPLRPLNNILWGYLQDEQNRLSVRRRAYEYDHHYGLTLYGKVVPRLHSADSRSKFLEGFHNLLNLGAVFFKEDNDTTVIADGFPLLNALKEVHLTLAQGAHNQFGDLPWTARAEMLLQEWILARPEMRDFLQSRAMVPYKEAWMPQVDTMKTVQGWSDVTVTHFRDLGVYGEQILLSIRYGDWIDVNDEDSAKNWARYWRSEIQGYLHAYRAVTGIDLTNPDTVDATMPAIHLQNRLAAQQRAR